MANRGGGLRAVGCGLCAPRQFPATEKMLHLEDLSTQVGEVGGRLTGIPLWSQICDHLNYLLCARLKTFPILVLLQRMIHRNVRELFSYNRGISHLNETCRIHELSRGSDLGYKILIAFGFGLP
jgi:hypothetical protein